MRPEDAEAVRQLDLFALARQNTFDALVNGSFLQRFPPGVELIRQSDNADFLYILIEGQVEMFAQTGTRETTLDIVSPVGLFILAAVLNDDVCLQSARTLTTSRILMIPATHVRAAIEDDVYFMRAVVRELSRRYRKTIKELKNQKLRTSAERLANWLIKLNGIQNNHEYIELPFEKRLLASRLGMTPENLSRAFSTLSKYGIKVDGSRIVFVDMKKLVTYAMPDNLIDKIEPQ